MNSEEDLNTQILQSTGDQELLQFVRDLIPQLNALADRLERFTQDNNSVDNSHPRKDF